MKIEKRGKYAGVKVHLTETECELLMEITACSDELSSTDWNGENIAVKFASKLGKKISTLLEECPDLLKPRTPEEIKLELENELESATLKLQAMENGGDWKEIHVK